MRKYKSIIELKKNYDSAVSNQKLAEFEIIDHLYELSLKNPDCPITTSVMGNTVNKAKSLANKFYISTLPITTQFYFIEVIETYSEDISGIKQLKISFDE
jgi:hypothetical protein